MTMLPSRQPASRRREPSASRCSRSTTRDSRSGSLTSRAGSQAPPTSASARVGPPSGLMGDHAVTAWSHAAARAVARCQRHPPPTASRSCHQYFRVLVAHPERCGDGGSTAVRTGTSEGAGPPSREGSADARHAPAGTWATRIAAAPPPRRRGSVHTSIHRPRAIPSTARPARRAPRSAPWWTRPQRSSSRATPPVLLPAAIATDRRREGLPDCPPMNDARFS